MPLRLLLGGGRERESKKDSERNTERRQLVRVRGTYKALEIALGWREREREREKERDRER